MHKHMRRRDSQYQNGFDQTYPKCPKIYLHNSSTPSRNIQHFDQKRLYRPGCLNFFFFRLKKLRIVIFKTSFQDGTKVEVSSEIKPPLFRQVKSRQIRLGLTWHQIIQEHAIFYCVCIGAALVYRTLLCQSTHFFFCRAQ